LKLNRRKQKNSQLKFLRFIL